MNPAPLPSRAARWTGLILGLLACANLLFSAGIKQVQPAGVPEHFTHLGWALPTIMGLGFLEFACTVLYLVPRTAALGAILLTGYLGAAAAAHVRIGEGGVAVYPVCLGIFLWAGLWLRDPRLRTFLPLRH